MSSTEIIGRTFFPGSRKEVRVNGINLLRDAEGNPRIKLDVIMPFTDGKLVGMPTWVGEAFDHLGKEDTLETATKFGDLQIDGMSLYIHELPEQVDPTKSAFACLLRNFTMCREQEDEDDEELGDVSLKFVAYVPGDKRLWTWLYDYHRKKLWIRFESTQADISEVKAAPAETQLSLEQSQENIEAFSGKAVVEDEFEEVGRAATSKEHDPEFAPALAAQGKEQQSRKPRGFDRSGKRPN